MPFLLAQDFSILSSNLPVWQSLLVLVLMSPVVLSIVNGMMIYKQNQQKKELTEVQSKQAEDAAERKNQSSLIEGLNETNRQLLKLIAEISTSAEKRDERYFQVLNNLDKTVGGFGNILQSDNQERSEVFIAIKEMLEKQTQGLNANSEAMFALSESQDRAVQSMEFTSQATQKSVEEIKNSFMQMSAKLDAWGLLFQTAVGSTIDTNKELSQLKTNIHDMLELVKTEIGKVLSAVESSDDSNSTRLDKENVL